MDDTEAFIKLYLIIYWWMHRIFSSGRVYPGNKLVCSDVIWLLNIIANPFAVSNTLIASKKMFTNLEKSLVEDISVLFPVLPQDNLAEVRIVDQTVNIDFIGHVDHLLLTRIQA